MISFIVTSYNYSKYIEETIKSIQNQTIKDFEIIVVDDCSTDNSVEILEKIEGITLIKHSSNKGQFSAILTGLNIAKGEYVSIIDSDDTITENYAEVLLNAITDNEVALVCCNANRDSFLINAPFGGWFWTPMSCGLIKRSTIKCLQNYDRPDLWRICPDKFIFNIANLNGNSMLITDKLVNKREHENNAGKVKNRFWINVKNNFIIRHEALKIIKNKKLRKQIKTSYYYLFKQILTYKPKY